MSATPDDLTPIAEKFCAQANAITDIVAKLSMDMWADGVRDGLEQAAQVTQAVIDHDTGQLPDGAHEACASLRDWFRLIALQINTPTIGGASAERT